MMQDNYEELKYENELGQMEAERRDTLAQIDYFFDTLKEAYKYGLQTEFMGGFVTYIKSGDRIDIAANCAAMDWDF